jgi:hypothetical protein
MFEYPHDAGETHDLVDYSSDLQDAPPVDAGHRDDYLGPL